MKNWTKTGKIKALLLVLFALPNLLLPIGAAGQAGIEMILMPLIFGSFAIPLVVRFNASLPGREIAKPEWNDSPLNLKRPLSFFHFGACFFMSVGASILIGTGIKYHVLSFIGLTAVSFGAGILIGISLSLLWIKPKE